MGGGGGGEGGMGKRERIFVIQTGIFLQKGGSRLCLRGSVSLGDMIFHADTPKSIHDLSVQNPEARTVGSTRNSQAAQVYIHRAEEQNAAAMSFQQTICLREARL